MESLPLDVFRCDLLPLMDKTSIGRLARVSKNLSELVFQEHTATLSLILYGSFNPFVWAASRGYVSLLLRLQELAKRQPFASAMLGAHRVSINRAVHFCWEIGDGAPLRVSERFGHFCVWQEFLKTNDLPTGLISSPMRSKLARMASGGLNPKFLLLWLQRCPEIVMPHAVSLVSKLFLNTWQDLCPPEDSAEEGVLLEIFGLLERSLPSSFFESPPTLRSPNHTHSWVISAFWVQAMFGRAKMIRLLSKKAYLPERHRTNFVQSLVFAVRWGNLACVKELLEICRSYDCYPDPPLANVLVSYCAQNGITEAMELLQPFTTKEPASEPISSADMMRLPFANTNLKNKRVEFDDKRNFITCGCFCDISTSVLFE